jgi:hypothetical protein
VQLSAVPVPTITVASLLFSPKGAVQIAAPADGAESALNPANRSGRINDELRLSRSIHPPRIRIVPEFAKHEVSVEALAKLDSAAEAARKDGKLPRQATQKLHAPRQITKCRAASELG